MSDVTRLRSRDQGVTGGRGSWGHQRIVWDDHMTCDDTGQICGHKG